MPPISPLKRIEKKRPKTMSTSTDRHKRYQNLATIYPKDSIGAAGEEGEKKNVQFGLTMKES